MGLRSVSCTPAKVGLSPVGRNKRPMHSADSTNPPPIMRVIVLRRSTTIIRRPPFGALYAPLIFFILSQAIENENPPVSLFICPPYTGMYPNGQPI